MSRCSLYQLRQAFEYCRRLTKAHYENFPVASVLLPGDIRLYVYSIYAFARIADDIADEGSRSPDERLRMLDDWETQLHQCIDGNATHPVFIALAETIARKNIPCDPFVRLLQAFRMDVTTNRFASFGDVLFYCRHSANPVGELVLHLFECATPQAVELSDSICTGLQLANFWQDFRLDWHKDRLYIPLEDLEGFGYTEENIRGGKPDQHFRNLMHWQVDRAKGFLTSGVPLLAIVPRRLRFELDATIRGGLAILKKIEHENYDVMTKRPVLSTADKARILLDAVMRQSL